MRLRKEYSHGTALSLAPWRCRLQRRKSGARTTTSDPYRLLGRRNVLGEALRVLPETELLKPIGNVLHRSPRLWRFPMNSLPPE